MNILLHIYAVHAWPETADPALENVDQEDPSRPRPGMNGHARLPSEAAHIHDAEAFELQGLISDEEEEARAAGRQSMGPQKAEDDEENHHLTRS